MLTLPGTDTVVHELCLGENVFGWGADDAGSIQVLNAYRSHGGNFIYDSRSLQRMPLSLISGRRMDSND